MQKIAQNVIGWSVFVILVCAICALGANRPVSWTLMSVAVFVCFAAQICLDVMTKRPVVLNRVWVPAILFLSVLVWGALQRMPVLPAAWAHPVWNEAGQALSTISGSLTTSSSLLVEGEAVVSADPTRGAHILMRLATYAMVFWIALRMAAERARALVMVRAFALTSSLFAIYGLFAWTTGNNPILGDATTGSLSSTFVNRNNYATFAGFGMLANLAVFLNVSHQETVARSNPILSFIEGFFTRTWIWMFGVILCGGAMLLTQSRAGSVAGIIGLLVFFSAYRSKGEQSTLWPMAIVGGSIVAVFLTSAFGVIDRVMSTSDENGRFAIFPRVIEAIFDRPLLGHGLGAFEDVFRAYVPIDSARGEWDLAHNSYLENMFELGLPAAALFYLALSLLGARLLRGLTLRKRSRTILSFALGCFVAAAFHAGFDFSLQMPALAAFFAWILGIGYAQSFPEAQMKPRRSRQTIK